MEQRWSVTLGVASVLLTAVLTVGLVPSLLSAQVLERRGTEFQVNTYTTDHQREPSVAAAGNGDFVIVWASLDQDGSYFGIFGQRYANSGNALGTEFPVNTYTSSEQRFPAVASAANGDFVVVWMSDGQDGSLSGVFGQRYASSGRPLGREFQVNSYTTSSQAFPAVAAASDGTFVVVWAGDGIVGQRYTSGGHLLGTEFRIDTYRALSQGFPAVAAASNGDFIVVWVSYPQDGDYDGVFGQRYASNGSPLGTEFQVNTYTTNLQGEPAVAAASNGNFVVVWTSIGPDGSGQGIFGQRYASDGSALGTEFQVNSYTTGSQAFPAVAAASNGEFIVVWTSPQDGSYDGVFGQRYASDGSPLGTEFRVNTYTTLFQALPAIAATGNGDFVVAWESPQDGYGYGVFAQRYGVTRCAATPLGGCAVAGKSVLLIKDKSPAGASAKDKLGWKWLKGPATTQAAFGDPTMTAVYTFCIYTGTAQILTMEADVPPVDNWQAMTTNGYKYTGKTANATGISRIVLEAGASSTITVKGRDGHLDLMPSTLPLDGLADVIVQLSNTDNSNCWQAAFPTASVTENTETKLKAKTP